MGPVFDANPRTFSYQVMPPANAIGLATFSGAASYDGVVTLGLSGQRTTSYLPTPTYSLATIGLGRSFHIGLKGAPGQVFLIEDSTNLTTWQLDLTVTLDTSGAYDFYDPITTNKSRFYQVLLQVP